LINKKQVDKYINDHLSAYSDTHEYRLALVSQTHGVYSGIVSMVKPTTNKKRYLDFILDFTDRSLTISGISGKRLKESAGLLNEVFNNGEYKVVDNLSETSVQTLDTIKYLGMLYGSLGREPIAYMNIGRGVIRALHSYPVAETYVKEFSDQMSKLFDRLQGHHYGWGNDKEYFSNEVFPHWNLICWYQEQWNNGIHKPLQKLLAISKDTYKRLKTDKLLEQVDEQYSHDSVNFNNYLYGYCTGDRQSKNFYILPIQMIQEIDKVNWNKLEQTVKQVDDERGYHEYKTYYDSLSNSMINYLKWVLNGKGYSWGRTLGEVAEAGNTDIFHLAHYLYASCYHQQALDLGVALQILDDYYNLVSKTKNFVKFPRYLKTAHDIASRNAKELGNSLNQIDVYNVYNKYQYLETSFKEYSMILGASPKEIVDEGQLQHNCVGGYVKDVAEGKSIIMFLRKKADIYHSWVTVELRGDKDGLEVVQTYGTFNTHLNPEQKVALATWMKLMGVTMSEHAYGLKTTNKDFMKLAKSTTSMHQIDMHFHEDAFKAIKESKAKTTSIDTMKIKEAS
jgi:hypothetical protein